MSDDWPDLLALPGVREAAQTATVAVQRVHTHPANRRGWAQSASAAAIRAARASAAIDGAPIALDASAESVADPILAGAVRIAAELPALVAVWSRSPLQVLARLHTLAAADLVDADDLGRPRVAGGRLTGVADLVRATPWVGPIMVGVVLGELGTLRPFGSADGVVARAAARLTAASTGLDPRGLTVPEVGWLREQRRIDGLLMAYGSGDSGAVANWLIGVCELLEAGSREGFSIAEAAN